MSDFYEEQISDLEDHVGGLEIDLKEASQEIERLREALVSKGKNINYCIGHIHGVSQLKYIERLCRNTEKILEQSK